MVSILKKAEGVLQLPGHHAAQPPWEAGKGAPTISQPSNSRGVMQILLWLSNSGLALNPFRSVWVAMGVCSSSLCVLCIWRRPMKVSLWSPVGGTAGMWSTRTVTTGLPVPI